MTIESQIALLVMIIIVVISWSHLKSDNTKMTLPNPQHWPFWIGAFIMILVTIFYIIKAFTESIKILVGR